MPRCRSCNPTSTLVLLCVACMGATVTLFGQQLDMSLPDDEPTPLGRSSLPSYRSFAIGSNAGTATISGGSATLFLHFPDDF